MTTLGNGLPVTHVDRDPLADPHSQQLLAEYRQLRGDNPRSLWKEVGVLLAKTPPRELSKDMNRVLKEVAFKPKLRLEAVPKEYTDPDPEDSTDTSPESTDNEESTDSED